MLIADTLSHANLPAPGDNEFIHSLEEVDHTASVTEC